MATPERGAKRRWAASAVGSAAVVTCTLLLFRAPDTAARPRPLSSRRPAITFSPGRGDELIMRDLAPLFLPTEHNASSGELPRRDPGQTLLDYDAEKLRFGATNPAPSLPMPFTVPASPAEALGDTRTPLALGFGRTDAQPKAIGSHGAQLDIFGSDKDTSLLHVVLPPEARPKFEDSRDSGWQPLEFLATVDAVGLVGPLVLTASSGREDVDNHFRSYLARTFRVGDRLSPGTYRIVVGP